MADFLPRGVHHIDPDRYHADPSRVPSLSSSLARVILDQSPLHAWAKSPRLNPNFKPEEKKTFDIGRAFHREMLGAGEDYAIIPEGLLSEDGGVRTKAAREYVEAIRADGLTPVKAAEIEAIRGMVESAKSVLRDLDMTLAHAGSEITILTEIEGTSCRALIDNLPAGKPYFIDLKSCEDASPNACIRAVTNYGLDVQVEHYRSCIREETGEDRVPRFVFVEKSFPYGVSVIELYDGRHIADLTDPDRAPDWWEDAEDKIRDARFYWRNALETGRWRGYPRNVATIGAPSYHRQKWVGRAVTPKPDRAALETGRQMMAPHGDAS